MNFGRYGPAHRSTLRAKHNLAQLLHRDRENLEEACSLFEEVSTRWEVDVGRYAPSTFEVNSFALELQGRPKSGTLLTKF